MNGCIFKPSISRCFAHNVHARELSIGVGGEEGLDARLDPLRGLVHPHDLHAGDAGGGA